MRALGPLMMLGILSGCVEGGAPVTGVPSSGAVMAQGGVPGFVRSAPSGCLIYWPHAVTDAERPDWSGGCDDGRVHGAGTVTWRRSDGEMRLSTTYRRGFMLEAPSGEYVLPDGTRITGRSVDATGLEGVVRVVTPAGETRSQIWEFGQLVTAGPQPFPHAVRIGRTQRTYSLTEAMEREASVRLGRTPAPAAPTPTGAIATPATPNPPAQPAGGAVQDPHRHPASGGQDWVADARTNCRIYDPWVLGPHRVTWSGPCVNGRAEGVGVLVGEWVGEGEPHTDRYEGPMRAGRRHGRGVTTFTAASRTDRTEGTWRDGLLQGPVLITSTNGHRFQGSMVDGRAEGRGSLRFVDGVTYEGEFAASLRSGRGVQVWPDGTRCEGQFREGALNGQAVCTFANGNRYEGGFAAGRQSGRGVMTFANGGRYDGDWADGRSHGHGVRVWPNGDRYEGGFAGGQLSGRGVMTFANGNRYEGELLEDRHNGRGTFQWANGNVYDGHWRAGRAQGQGSHRYFGEWVSGWFENGCLRTTIGSRHIARWVGPTDEDGSWCRA